MSDKNMEHWKNISSTTQDEQDWDLGERDTWRSQESERQGKQ